MKLKNILIIGLITYVAYVNRAFLLLTYEKYANQTETVEEINDSNVPQQTFGFNFVKTSNHFNIDEDMVMDDGDFNKKSKHYSYIINKTFLPSHLAGLKEILIANASAFSSNYGSNEDGECESIGKQSFILIAGFSPDNDKVLLHEICHSMQNQYMSVFNEIRGEWKQYDDYVTDYAKTNIDEDFAETGAYYLSGDTGSGNPKFALFKRFFEKVKNM